MSIVPAKPIPVVLCDECSPLLEKFHNIPRLKNKLCRACRMRLEGALYRLRVSRLKVRLR